MATLSNALVESADNHNQSVDELLRQYPWFTKEEIAETVKRFGNRRERILAYLDLKSGHWSYLDMFD